MAGVTEDEVRVPVWEAPGAWSTSHPLYKFISALAW